MQIIKLIVNGKEHNVIVEPHETLAHVLCEKINLTGAKLGCYL